MTNNFKPNDLKEIIVVYLPAVPHRSARLVSVCVLERNAQSNPDRILLAICTVRKPTSPQTDESDARRAPPFREIGFNCYLKRFRVKAMSGWLRRSAFTFSLAADLSNS